MTAEVRDVRRNGRGRGLCGGPGKRVDGVFSGRPQSFRHQRRPPVDDCSLGRGRMAQNGRTRGGTFHGKMDRCRKKQGTYGDREIFIFPVQLTTCRIGNLIRLIHTLLYVMTIHDTVL